MRILNQEYDFEHITAQVRGAFRGVPQRVVVPVGERLFRMVTTEDYQRSGNGILTGQWWFDQTVRTRLSQIAARTGSTLPAAAQTKLAVTRRFSPQMEYLCGIVMKKPVYAWRGQSRWQADAMLGVTLIGGLEQYFIPSLAATTDGLFSDAATLDTWAYMLG